MIIQVNTDHTVQGSSELNNYIESSLFDSFERFDHALTRIEVHLSDSNGNKKTHTKHDRDDKCCLLEARISHHRPIVVTHYAKSIDQAIEHASHKLLRSLDNMADKLTKHIGPRSFLIEELDLLE